MPVIDIIFRVEEICKKYDKYDVDKQRELGASGDDAFSRLYTSIDSDIEAVLRVRLLSLFPSLLNTLDSILIEYGINSWGICLDFIDHMLENIVSCNQ